jgi:predicted GH43/DUF377 family glycosyl hydrolase
VLARVLATSEADATTLVDDVRARYAGRHRDLDAVLTGHYEQIAHRVPSVESVSPVHRDLIGAVFTSEYALEAAALFNPSVVPHPDQTGLAPGHLRFVLSLRAVGEGHISSVEFRTGVVDGSGAPRLDPPGTFVGTGLTRTRSRDRALFAAQLAEQGADRESASYLVAQLGSRFDDQDLEDALGALGRQAVTRLGGVHTAVLARQIALESYETTFPDDSRLAERVLWPWSPSESQGIEDLRLVRFTAQDGTLDYRGTYTAFDGERISPHMIHTPDFRRFAMTPLAGPAARDKGMALFPRQVGGRHVALSRWDRESNAVTMSDDGLCWDAATTLVTPTRTWQLIQTGNCGSPIETPAGWLVLTHGVGPMREYAIGALLLDLDDPTRVIGALREPLLRPAAEERDGYVPNVVYSCGALRHGDRLLLPYGASDVAVRFAIVDLPLLLDRLSG